MNFGSHSLTLSLLESKIFLAPMIENANAPAILVLCGEGEKVKQLNAREVGARKALIKV